MKIVEWMSGIWYCLGPFPGTYNTCDESISLIQNYNNDFIVMRVTKVLNTDYSVPIKTEYYTSYDEAKVEYDKMKSELEWHLKQNKE